MNFTKKTVLISVVCLILFILQFFLEGVPVMGTAAVIMYLAAFLVIDKVFKIHFKLAHYLLLIFMVIMGVTIGGFAYFLYPQYDKILHATLPFFGAIILFYALNKTALSFKMKLFLTFTTVMTFLTLQEIGEYLLDVFLNLKLQGVYLTQKVRGLEVLTEYLDKNDDTMIDLLLGLISCMVFTLYKIIDRELIKH
ncbi:MAG: hypothetical protein KKE50_02695 [Nanoarchaeota archaeon]|nr:hypothetical protein [Nanoarchaeota archaeon]